MIRMVVVTQIEANICIFLFTLPFYSYLQIELLICLSCVPGRVPKIHLLKPEFVVVITAELMLLMWKKITGQPVKPSSSKKEK